MRSSRLQQRYFLLGAAAFGGLSVLAFLMSIIRCIATDTGWLLFMNWNLFLAWVPVVCVYGALYRTREWYARWSLLGMAILFLPNAPYMVTDFKHLYPDSPVYWYDSMMLFLYALTGILIYLWVVYVLYRRLRQCLSTWWAWGMMMGLSVATSIGVYLGRSAELRFNSWDVVGNPGELLATLLDLVMHPGSYDQFGTLTLGWSLALGGLVSMVVVLDYYWQKLSK